MIKIPKQFKFAGITFTVEIVDDIHNEDDSYDYGQLELFMEMKYPNKLC